MLSRKKKRKAFGLSVLRNCIALALPAYVFFSSGLAQMYASSLDYKKASIASLEDFRVLTFSFVSERKAAYAPHPRIIHITSATNAEAYLKSSASISTHSPSSRNVEAIGGPCKRCTDQKPLYSKDLKAYYEQCTPIAAWQTTFHPTCNSIHEVPLADNTFEAEEEASVLNMEGGIRSVWKVRNSVEVLIMKLVHLDLDINRVWTENKRDAMALDVLSKSDRVVDIYGFCGQSQLTEVAEDFGWYMIKKAAIGSVERLRIGLETARALVDVHSVDYPNSTMPSLAHSDLHVDNIVTINGKIKLNDFNRAIPLRMNGTKTCGYPEVVGYHRWRSRESWGNFGYLDPSMADMYSIGNLYYYLLTDSEPWKYLEPGGYMERSEVRHSKVAGKIVPHVPPALANSSNPVDQVLYSAAMACYRAVPEERPTSYEVAVGLERALEWITQKKNTTRDDMWNLFHKS